MALCKQWSDACENEELSEAIDHGVCALGHDRVRPLQAKAVQPVLRGRDTFVNVPTGYGKSLVYQILPICACFLLATLWKESSVVPVVLVVIPLVVLMHDQAQELRQWKANVLLLSEDSAEATAGWTCIFAIPEAFLQSSKWRKLLLNSSLVNSLVALVIDETHCIVQAVSF